MEFSKDLGPKPELIWLDPEEILIDRSYQRDCIASRVKKILLNFNWRDFQPPTVAKGDKGRIFAIDGQNRVKASQLHPKVKEIPCYMLGERAIEDQAQGFVNINTQRDNVHPVNIYWAGLTAKDPDALRLEAVIAKTKVEIAPDTSPTGTPGHTAAIGALHQVIKRNGDDILVRTLNILYKAHPKDARTLSGLLIRSTGRLLYINPSADDDLLYKAIASFNLNDLLKDSLAVKQLLGGSSETAILKILVKKYNGNFRGKDARRLLEKEESKKELKSLSDIHK
ncbi:hypothetical protein LCGC14_1530770 [marine sediment metagenome]|uniref:ParB/Sulfiredoxin domain-containing protein n=1 Tax=marine sediment metagenome TaxID=412755 RepID=A0A0F9IVW1_9ZZZZ